MAHDAVTFGLAGAGYLLLAKDTALRLRGRRWPALGAWTAVVVAAHVVLVWALRFEWSVDVAWQKGAAAFVVFHAAFLLVGAAPFVRGRARDRMTFLAFGIVSTGALPATLRYPEVGVLGIPLLAAFLGVAMAFLRRRAASPDKSTGSVCQV